MGHILSHPVQSKNLQRFGDAACRVGVAEMQGYRTNQEDAHCVALALAKHPHIAFISVYDGHNGGAASEYMAKHMASRLDELTDPTDHAQLTAAVEKADADFMSDQGRRVHGSTSCLALIKSGANGARTLTVANTGDSRCLVLDAATGEVKFTTTDHKPETAGEEARIRAAGGTVSMGRVDGDLAMSRSIGDYAYKNMPHLAAHEQKVIATPDVTDIELAPTDLVLVCCDGLVERLTNEAVAKFVYDQIASHKAANGGSDASIDPAAVMAALLDFSLVRGSKDNMSAVLMVPVPGTNYGRADEYRVGPFTEWSSNRMFVDAYMTDARKHGFSQEQTMDLIAKQAKEAAASGMAETNGGAGQSMSPPAAMQNPILLEK